jgi:hypothetical protein
MSDAVFENSSIANAAASSQTWATGAKVDL